MAVTATPPVYRPLPVPPEGGLLQTLSGTPQQPAPPQTAAQQNPWATTVEDDDVVGQLNAITAADSGYMQLARTSGLQTANKRGLLNSSLAAGASQAAAIAAAAPLAQQNAGQAAQRNLARVSGYYDAERQAQDIASREGMLDRQIKSEEERLGRQLTSQEMQQQRDIASRMQMQNVDITSQQQMQQQQIAASTRLAEMNIQAESERLGRQLTAAEEQQIRDIASRETLQTQELTSREQLTREGYASEWARANLDADTRLALTELQNLNDNQRAALSYYLGQDQLYAQSVSNLWANKDIPAPARDAAMQQFLALKNSGANLPTLLFGLNLSWGTPTTGTTTGGTTGGTTTPTTTTGGMPPAPTLPSGTAPDPNDPLYDGFMGDLRYQADLNLYNRTAQGSY